MNTIPFITRNNSLYSKVSKLVKKCIEEPSECINLDDFDKSVEYLNIEMPELVIIDLSNRDIDVFALLDIIMGDTWLLHGGIILLTNNNKDLSHIDKKRGLNIIVDLHYDEVKDNLGRILSIIFSNRRIIFQRSIGSDIIQNISGSFKLDNDPLEVKCYTNLICNFLYNANKLDVNNKFNLQLAMHELLLNAIEHGNCNIDYHEKSQWLEKYGTINGLIKQRNSDSSIASKKVFFDYVITPTSAKFVISDQGNGFNWREINDARDTENMLKMNGRGILMSRNVVQNLTYNEKGNEVRFEIGYQSDASTITPGLFKNLALKKINAGDIIFREGEPSNFLYYIVKGRYKVLVHRRQVSLLTPDDIFVGEMSFLLNNRRSAAVEAETDGLLIQVSKKEFVEAIKTNPHYALFLSRLLAQRIQRLNQTK